MKRPKFTEEQIAFALKQGESGVTVAEVCRLNEYLLGEVERRRKKDEGKLERRPRGGFGTAKESFEILRRHGVADC